MVTRSILLGTTAIAALALAACNNSNDPGIASVAEIGPFGFTVGEPVDVISATRSDGTAFDKYSVTFNNAEGTNITITTPEGEEIVFDADDPDSWIGEDPRSRPRELARVTSERGDVLEVFLGEAWGVPVLDDNNEVDGNESQVVYARARLDEADTRDGFESYMVTGLYTDPEALPRHSGDDAVFDDDGICTANCAGTLMQGTAEYYGDFNGTVFKGGNVLSDTASGSVSVSLDFAAAEGSALNGGPPVSLTIDGQYTYDDLDDEQPKYVVGLTYDTVTIDGIDYVESVTPVYGNPVDNQNVVTGLDVEDVTLFEGTPIEVTYVTSVTPRYDPIRNGGENIVTSIDPITDSTDDTTLVVRNLVVNYGYDHDDTYDVDLSSIGETTDISFENGQVTYTGALEGTVEIPTRFGSTDYDVGGVDSMGTEDPTDDIQHGEFAGAVFGPGAAAYEGAVEVIDGESIPLDPSFNEIIEATATAGVFEAGSELDERHEDGFDPTVEIVGSFGASAD